MVNRPPMSPRRKAAAKKAARKQEVVNSVKTAAKVGLGTGAAGAVLKASEMAYPESTTRITSKAVQLDDGSSAMRDMFERVPGVAAPMHDIINSAMDVGVKAAGLGVLGTLVYKGGRAAHKALNEWQFGRR